MAVGQRFPTLALAEAKYDELYGGSWATRLYDASLNVIKQYGWMSDSDWAMLDQWAQFGGLAHRHTNALLLTSSGHWGTKM